MERFGLEPGTPVGGYTVVAPLGSGGMGAVYRAVDDGGHAVALKLLHPDVGADPVARARLVREVAALQRLRHPAVAQVLDAEADSTEAFLVTELVPGMSLDRMVRSEGPLADAALAELAARLRDALRAVHSAGVVHRDLKPSNVMVTPDGPVLIDFGLALGADDAPLTSTSLIAGTPGYLAPELIGGAAPGPSVDWWGWAAVLAFAATGRPPFGSGAVPVVLARTASAEADLVGLPARTRDVLHRALAADPPARPGPDEVCAALADQAAGVPWTPPVATVDHDAATDVLRSDATEVIGGYGTAAAAPGVELPGAAVAGAGAAGPARDGRTQQLPRAGDGAAPLPAAPLPSPLPVDQQGGGVLDPTAEDDETGGLPLYQRPPARRRWGSLLALTALVAAAGAQYPALTLAAVVAAMVVVRTVGRAVEHLHDRRERLGVRRGDASLAGLATPWHLVTAVLGVLPAVIVAGAVVVILGGFGWWAAGHGTLPLTDAGAGEVPAGPWVGVALGAIVLVGAMVAWFGPLSRLTRTGARRTLAALAPGWIGALVVVGVALAATAVLVTRVVSGYPVDWWPLPAPVLHS